jgi:hypothetical protein
MFEMMIVNDELERKWKPVLINYLSIRLSAGQLKVTMINSIFIADDQQLLALFSYLKRAEYYCQSKVIFQFSEKIH